MSKHANLDINDAAYLDIVHHLQYPTSRQTTQSTKITIVNGLNKHFAPLLAGRYGKSTQRSTQQCHQANEGKSGVEAERI
jgi:hypothetical protein